MGRVGTAICGFALVIVGALAARPAAAYMASGDRQFPATLVLPQLAPGDEFYLNFSTLPLGGGAGAPDRSSNLTATYAKTITDRLGVVIEETYTGIGQSGAGTLWGWQNLDGEIKYLAVNDFAHE